MNKHTSDQRPLSVVMLGASGAVGGEALKALVASQRIGKITLLGRRTIDIAPSPKMQQHVVDVFSSASYQQLLAGHDAAVCTFGVGESSKVSKAELTKIDKDAVVSFATACRLAGVRHFEMLCSVGADAQSASFYLRVKGELQNALIALNFERLSLFQPSMILTPTNRYGLTQGLTLAIWPVLKPVLLGPLRKLRGIPVETLGSSMTHNLFTAGKGTEYLQWDDFMRLSGQ